MSNAGTGTPGARSIHEEDEQVLAAQQHVTLSTAPGPAPADVTSPQKPVQEAQTPYPLPMPPYGGYFAPMTELLPGDSAGLPNPPYQRCISDVTTHNCAFSLYCLLYCDKIF